MTADPQPTSTVVTTVQGAALAWHDAGFCVLPAAADGSKRPGVGSWKTYQQQQQFPREALTGDLTGIGLVCGAISGGLEMLEAEGRAMQENALQKVAAEAEACGIGALWRRVTTEPGAYVEMTPSGGVHILYRITGGPVPGNTKLANRPARDGELTDDERALVAKGRTVIRGLAETRGEGGYVVVAPSGGPTHPTGQPWRLAVGQPGVVPTVTLDERQQLHDLFRVIDQAPPRAATGVTTGVDAAPPRPAGVGLSPGDDFAARTEWPAILEPAGWRVHYQAEGITYWTRPGKDTGTSATTNANGTDRLYVHTSSTEFEPQESYSKFGAYAVLYHGGDHSAAARELAARGYGTPASVGLGRAGERLPAPSDPMAVARVIEPELVWGTSYTLWNWRGGWWQWQVSHWAEIEVLALRKRLYGRTEHAVFMVMTKDGPEDRKWSPDQKKIGNLADALAGIVHLHREIRVPSWLTGDRGLGTVVACRNGLLKLAGRELLSHDAAYFNLVAVPFDYDPAADEPKEWLKFLEVLWPDGGAGQVDALQEWFGYVISGRTDLQKIFAIIGPPRSGKGTIAAVLTELAGAANVAGPTLASLATNFGLAPLLGKSLALISDARIGRSTDTSVIVERLLTISGEDTISVDRKHLAAWEGRIPARIMLLSNELPRFSDSSATIGTRFIVTETTESFLGREDRFLRARLMAELPSILNWALTGLERLLARGHFTATEVSRDAVDVMRQTASPYAPFVDDECVVGPEYEVAVDRLWMAWKTWCMRNDRDKAGVKQWLGRDLKSVVPGLKMIQRSNPDGSRYRAYQGLGLRSDHPTAVHAQPGTLRVQEPRPEPPLPAAATTQLGPLHAHARTSPSPARAFSAPSHTAPPGDARTNTRMHAHSELIRTGDDSERALNPLERCNGDVRVHARADLVDSPPAAEPRITANDPDHCPRCNRRVAALAWLPCDRCGTRTHARGRGAHGTVCNTCLTERTAS